MQLNIFSNEFEQDFLLGSVLGQTDFETGKDLKDRQKNGVFYTNCLDVIDTVLSSVLNDQNLIKKKILEPSCGNGIFIQKILLHLIKNDYSKIEIKNFIENNIIINDLDVEAIAQTKNRIAEIYRLFFGCEYKGTFLAFNIDFTKVIDNQNLLFPYLGTVDYVVGNPPFVALYGRRDKKKTEELRNYYLDNFYQFPKSLKNGKINLSMMFVENGLKFLKSAGELAYILDVSLFETAFKHTRKFLLENTFITEIHTNIKAFDVASGQVVFKTEHKREFNKRILIKDHESGKETVVNQEGLLEAGGEYKFTYYLDKEISLILNKIREKKDRSLKELYPKKNLRTCCMLLDMEERFTSAEDHGKNALVYPYYEGGKSLKKKFSELTFKKYFHYNKDLQDQINDDLKAQLIKEGIKNKKRIGLGESIVYDNPKVFIRQSAKEIIATYTEEKSSANNSLYVFTLRSNDIESKAFLKFLCGFLNSSLVTFYSQVERIIRYSKGKQPQIKTGDLYQLTIPEDSEFRGLISKLVGDFYDEKNYDSIKLISEIDKIVYSYYKLTKSEIRFISQFSEAYLTS